MCAPQLDVTGFYGEVGEFYKGIWSGPKPPTPIPPPRKPTKTAEKIYGAKDDGSQEPNLIGTSALQIPLKTIQ